MSLLLDAGTINVDIIVDDFNNVSNTRVEIKASATPPSSNSSGNFLMIF